MTDRISEKNKQIIAKVFSEALGEQAPKKEFHQRLFGKYRPAQNDAGDTSEPENTSSEFQRLREHSQDFRSFAKERFEQEFAQKQSEDGNGQNQK